MFLDILQINFSFIAIKNVFLTSLGTRIIYDRSFLLKCRNSPMSNTSPSNLPDIPGVTSPEKSPSKAITKIEEKEIVKENGGISAFI